MNDPVEESRFHALTHLDGRNAQKLTSLRSLFSESSWIEARITIMISYLEFVYPLIVHHKIPHTEDRKLQALCKPLSRWQLREIKQFEKTVNHDIKAIELYIGKTMRMHHLDDYIPYLNIGIGSEDINNIAFSLSLHKAKEIIGHEISVVARQLVTLGEAHSQTLMVARTHGLPANVTTLGKEISNYLLRFCDIGSQLQKITLHGKCSGEVGTYQAQSVIAPKLDWINSTDAFVISMGLVPHHGSTQITPYDSVAQLFHAYIRLNSICIALVRDLWMYIMLGYLCVVKKTEEVGSAGMPHKVNPIYLEGAEGNFGMATMLFEGLARELPVNRLQRSFTDSTMRRNVVLPFSFMFLAFQSLAEGLLRLSMDQEVIQKDVDSHGEIWIETIKTYGLMHGIIDMYDRLKKETRGKVLTKRELSRLIAELPLQTKEKEELARLCTDINPNVSKIVQEACTRTKNVFSL